MTELEFDIIDEMYFLVSFDRLQQEVSLEAGLLADQLASLHTKGWIRILAGEEDATPSALANFKEEYRNYNYLASKAGLLAHNSR